MPHSSITKFSEFNDSSTFALSELSCVSIHNERELSISEPSTISIVKAETAEK